MRRIALLDHKSQGMPTSTSCSFNPGSVKVSQATPTAQVTLTVTTTAPSMSIPVRLPVNRGWRTTTEVIALLVCALYVGLVLRFRINQHWSSTSVAMLTCALLVCTAGCGGGSSASSPGGGGNPGTPTGTTNAIITLTSTGITHSFVFTLNVHPSVYQQICSSIRSCDW